MVEPVTIASGILAGVGTAVSLTLAVIGELVKHPVVSFALVVGILIFDSPTNIFGSLVSWGLGMMGIPFKVASFHLAVLGILIPLCWLALQLSARINVSARR